MKNSINENNSSLQNETRDSFGSKFGIIAAAAGSAIGLGNIWKFPYIVGENGGGAFLFIYLLCIAVIGIPVMTSAFIIGRRSQKNPVGAFKKLAPNSKWSLTGMMMITGAIMMLAFYGSVAGWTLDYIVKSLSGSFSGKSAEEMSGMFNALITSPVKPVLWQVSFIGITAFIVLAGIKNGIEKYSKILMPILLGVLILLGIRGITLQGGMAGVEFLFKPDFSKLSVDAILIALGHAFFSLSIGTGIMITYGSYISKKENLVTTALQVTLADTAIALLSGLAIFPAVFAFGIEPGQGVGLVFLTLPSVFQQMTGGYIFGILFFGLLSVAALTSAISVLETVVAYLTEEKQVNRKKATVIASVVITLLGVLCTLSFGVLSDFKLFGKNFFDLLDFIVSANIMPLGGLLMCIFVGWKLKKVDVEDEITSGGKLSNKLIPFLRIMIMFVAPLAVLIVYINTLFSII